MIEIQPLPIMVLHEQHTFHIIKLSDCIFSVTNSEINLISQHPIWIDKILYPSRTSETYEHYITTWWTLYNLSPKNTRETGSWIDLITTSKIHTKYVQTESDYEESVGIEGRVLPRYLLEHSSVTVMLRFGIALWCGLSIVRMVSSFGILAYALFRIYCQYQPSSRSPIHSSLSLSQWWFLVDLLHSYLSLDLQS